MNAIIKIRSLMSSFATAEREVHALGPIDLEIEERESLCIIGKSGCGKSTLLRALAGLAVPRSGEVLFDGEPIAGPSYRRGIIFQQPALLPWLSVSRNIELGFRIRRQPIPRALVERTIDLVGLRGFERAYPRNLSGGMAQRAAIARALVSTPDLLLLDEPFSALDAFTRLRMQQEVQRIWLEKRFTMVFITHDIDEAITLATRVMVMTPRPGRIARIFQIPLSFPRAVGSAEFLRLKSVISEELLTMIAADEAVTEAAAAACENSTNCPEKEIGHVGSF